MGSITIGAEELHYRWRCKPKTVALYLHLRFLAGPTMGEIATTHGQLSGATGLTVQEVRTALINILSTDLATDLRRGNFLIITINKTVAETAQQQTFQQTFNRPLDDGISTGPHIRERVGSSPSLSSLRSERKKERKKNPPHPPFKTELFDDAPHIVKLPDWLPQPEWDYWLEMRKAKRAPATTGALTGALHDLERFRSEGMNPAAILRQSTVAGWTGLFPLKANTRKAIRAPETRKHSRNVNDENQQEDGGGGG